MQKIRDPAFFIINAKNVFMKLTNALHLVCKVKILVIIVLVSNLVMDILLVNVKVDQPIWKDITQKDAGILKRIKMDKVYYCTVIVNMFVKPEIVKVHAKHKEDAKEKVFAHYFKQNGYLVWRIEVYDEEEYKSYKEFLNKHNFVFPMREIK